MDPPSRLWIGHSILQEVDLGLKAGFEPQQIMFTPNGVSLKEIEAVAQRVQINIDNLSILEQFEADIQTYPFASESTRNGRRNTNICGAYRL